MKPSYLRYFLGLCALQLTACGDWGNGHLCERLVQGGKASGPLAFDLGTATFDLGDLPNGKTTGLVSVYIAVHHDDMSQIETTKYRLELYPGLDCAAAAEPPIEGRVIGDVTFMRDGTFDRVTAAYGDRTLPPNSLMGQTVVLRAHAPIPPNAKYAVMCAQLDFTPAKWNGCSSCC